MPTFLVTTALVVAGSLGLSTVASTFSYHNDQVENPNSQVVIPNKNIASANDYYFQSWNCLTDF